MAASAELSPSVERWRRRYLVGQNNSLDASQAKCKSRRSLISTEKMDSSLDDTIASLLKCSSQLEYTGNRRKQNTKHFSDTSKNVKSLSRQGDELDSLYGSSQRDIQPEFVGDFPRDTYSESVAMIAVPMGEASLPNFRQVDITLPSSLTVTTSCDYDSGGEPARESVRILETQELNGKNLIPSHFNQIYRELSIIHQKLQQEKLAQEEYALKLERREHCLAERETLLCRHEAALTKIRSVEEEVHTKFQIMKEQHEAEIQQLSEALKEKAKENKRLKSSFETLKELNDALRQQLNDVSEQNKKLEGQSRKVQARLENLQRKHEFLSIQKSKEAFHTAQERKVIKPEKTITSKSYKIPINSHIYDLLTVLMDWISDQHLSKLVAEEEKASECLLTGVLASSRNYTQEKCIRYATMTSTMRRLGEDLFKGVVPKGCQYISPEHTTDPKPKSAAFFKSSSLPLRLVSTLIIIKTVTQADYLAQAFDSLCVDLKTDEGKALFLDYQAVPVILSHIRISSKGVLSNAVDSLLQMTTQSRFLHPFLEACSNETFFRTCSLLLRNSKLDTQILEKLSILLQKLSKIKGNKKMFELFTIHLMIQELQRTTHPDHAFLCINLNSILFNLGLTKSNPKSNSLNGSQ
ncbi:coiled-coil domain-containing protein 138 isoform X3 [Podarcis raffonei]|uniref:coiled-coil domain-containing protein 138 isoform X3 n=1 Tax=Podarcis raffonei TaxID=65483 RepID=UPI0023297742|nr:coiled-coil domain-containing protein 138 isoform X3 [Podarcis raffonei]